MAESNRLLTESNKAISRPVVTVEYSFEKQASRDYNNAQNESTVFVVVQNVGTSPARDVLLTVSPPFDRASASAGVATTAFLNDLFSGETPIRMLTPGQKLKYVLDDAREALKSETLPTEYEVTATYTDLERTGSYADHFVLHMSPWGMSIAEADPLKRISKDIQFISQSLRDREKGLPNIAGRLRDLSDDAEKAPRRGVRGRPRIDGSVLRRRGQR